MKGKVELSYRTQSATIFKGRRKVTINQGPLDREPVQPETSDALAKLLSLKQVKRLVRKGNTAFLAVLKELDEKGETADSNSDPEWIKQLQDEFADVFQDPLHEGLPQV